MTPSLFSRVRTAFKLSRAALFRNFYEAASMGRRLGTWRPSALGPNFSALGDLATLRNRSRQSNRDNG